MDRSQAVFEAYDGVEVPLPGGRTVKLRPLTVSRAVYFLRMLDAAMEGDPDAQYRFLEEFSEEIGVLEEPLAPAEVFALGRSFLHLPTWTSPTVEEAETERATETASSGSG